MKSNFRMLRSITALLLAVLMMLNSVALAAPVMRLPAGLTDIAPEAFRGNDSLQTVVIPDGTSAIGDMAFADCWNLTRVEIPDSVQKMGSDVFIGCHYELMIVCSRKSYAAQYAADNGHRVAYTDGPEVSWLQLLDTVYPEGLWGVSLVSASLEGYDPALHGEPVWSLERIDQNEGDPLQAYTIEQDGWCGVFFRELNGQLGASTWRLSVSVGEVNDSFEFTVNVAHAPENLPTAITLKQLHYEKGQTYTFGLDSIDFVDGDVTGLEGNISTGVTNIQDYPVWRENEVAETEEGYVITFTRNARYKMPLCVFIGNVMLETEVVITVGDGMPEGELVGDTNGRDTFFLGGNEGFENVWLGIAYLPDSVLDESVKRTWTVEPLDENPVLELGLDGEWPNSYGMNMYARSCSGATGTSNYRVTLTLDNGEASRTYTADFAYTVAEMPENLPTEEDLWYPVDHYDVEAGETIVVRASDTVLNNLPEGLTWTQEFHNQQYLEERGEFTWTDDGFEVTVHEPLRSVFQTVARLAANHILRRDIMVTVAGGVAEDAYLGLSMHIPTVFTDLEEDGWMANVTLNGMDVMEGEQIAWSVESKTGEGLVDLYVGGTWDNSANLNVRAPSGFTGEETFTITAELNGVTLSTDVTLTVMERPENLPVNEDIQLTQSEHHLEVGEAFLFTVDDISIDESLIPAGMKWSADLWDTGDVENNGLHWIENGLEGAFDREGTYLFHAVIRLAVNCEIMRDVIIVVGDGMPDDVFMVTHQPFDTIYQMNGDGWWLGSAHLDGINESAGYDVQWSVEPVEYSGEDPVVSLRLELRGTETEIIADSVSGEEGYATWRIICLVNGEYSFEKEMTFHVVAQPENLPTDDDVQVPETNYYMNVGDTFEFTHDMIGLNGYDQYWEAEIHGLDWNLEHVEGYEWINNGFRVTFPEDGRYNFRAVAKLAANYYIGRDVCITVGNGGISNATIVCRDDVGEIYPNLSEMIASNWELENFTIFPSDQVEWKLERNTDEFSPEEPIVNMWISWISDNRDFVDITIGTAREEYACEEYTLTCLINGEAAASTTVYGNVVPMPENMPSELWVESDNFHINPGEEFVFTRDMFDITNGEVPENALIRREIRVDDRLMHTEGFEWIDNGFRVWPGQDSRYRFSVAFWIGNFCLTKDITLTVGSGQSGEVAVDWVDNAFEMYAHHGDLWVTDVFIHDYVPPVGCEIEWQLERISEGEQFVELYYADIWDENRSAGIHARQCSDNLGGDLWCIRAVAGDEVVLEREITLTLTDKPEDLYMSVQCNQEVYYLQPGEEFFFSRSDFGLTPDSNIPDGGHLSKEIWLNHHIEGGRGFEWIDDGFCVCLDEPGRYGFTVALAYNNYIEPVEINIIVGDGPEVIKNQPSAMASTNVQDDLWIGSAWMNRFYMREGEEITWDVEVLSYTNDYAPELYVNNTWESGLGANLHLRNLTGQEGECTYRVTACYGNFRWSQDYTITFCPIPENMPGNDTLQVVNDRVKLEAGQEYTLDYADILFDESLLPEGMSCRKEIWNVESIEWMDSFRWTETGLSVSFDKAGRYKLTAAVRIMADYCLTHDITIIVGDGMPEGELVGETNGRDTFFLGGNEGFENVWLGTAYLNDSVLDESVKRTWTVEPLDENPVLELGLDGEWPNSYGMNMYARSCSGATGTSNYRVTLTLDDGEISKSYSTDFAYTVVEMPENLPTEEDLWYPVDHYDVAAGETIIVRASDTVLNNLPEGINWTQEFHNQHYLEERGEFTWTDDGFEVTVYEPLSSVFQTVARLAANHILRRNIKVTVAGGKMDSFTLEVHQPFDTLYQMDSDGWWLASARMAGMNENAGYDVQWSVEPVEYSGEDPVVSLRLEPHGTATEIIADSVSGEEGYATWRIICLVNGEYSFEKEMTFHVVAQPENLPTDDDVQVPETNYYMNVGDTFEYTCDMIGLNGYDQYWEADIHGLDWNLDHVEGFEWINNGFRVTFPEDGRYNFRAVAKLAANYYIGREVCITVGNGGISNATIVCQNDVGEIYPNLSEMIASNWALENFTIFPSDQVEWKLERNTDEFSPEEPIVNMWISWISHNRDSVDITIGTAREEYACEEYTLTCLINGEAAASTTVYGNVVPMPENMPSELWVESDNFHINPGEEFVFTRDMFDIANGEVPENALIRREIRIDDRLMHTEGFDWIDNGFRVWPGQDSRYRFSVAFWIGNFGLTKDITLTVGSGQSGEVAVDWVDNSFEMYAHHGDLWVTDVFIHDYVPPAGCEIDWQLERISEGEQFVELYYADIWDENRSAGIHARQCSDNLGGDLWRIRAVAGEEVILEREVEVWISQRPDDLPTPEHIWVESEEYRLNVGETFCYDAGKYGLTEDAVQDGFRQVLHLNPEINAQNFRWTGENAFEATFNQDGRFYFHVALERNNYVITRQIRIIVGSGIPADAAVAVDQRMDTLYLGEGVQEQAWGVYANLQGYKAFDGETVKWSVHRQGEGEGCVDAAIDWVDDYNLSAALVFSGVRALGEETFEVVAETESGGVYSATFVIRVAELPEELPDSIQVNLQTEYAVGEELLFNSDMVALFCGEQVYEDRFAIYHNIDSSSIWHENESWYEDDMLHIRFWTEDTYEIWVTAAIGNYEIRGSLVITVGDGVCDDCHVSWDQQVFQLYADGNEGRWIGYAELQYYNLLDGEEIIWTLETDQENPPVELYIDNYTETGANIHMRSLTGETGDVCYRLTVQTQRYTQQFDIWLVVENRPDNLPTDLVLEDDIYWFDVGDTLHMNPAFDIADGEIPDGAYLFDEFWISDDTFGGEEIIREENGSFSVTFTRDGRYTFWAVRSINNVFVQHRVVVYVGSGDPQGVELAVDQRFHSAYAINDNNEHRVANVWLNGYELGRDEYIKWDLECISPAEGEAPAAELFLCHEQPDSLGAEVWLRNVSERTGEMCYRLTATNQNGWSISQDIHFAVNALPENMPGEMTGVETEVHLNPGDTYFFDDSLVGMDGQVPEGVEYYLEFFDGLDYMMFMPGFTWLENESFCVTFPRDGVFTFRVAWRIATNYCFWKDVTITIGEGRTQEPSLHVNSLADTVYLGEDQPARMMEVYLDYAPSENENILWEIETLYGDDQCVNFYINEIRDNDCTASLWAGVGNGEAGRVTYRIHVTTESGWRSWVEYTVEAAERPDTLPQGLMLPNLTIPVGEEFVYLPYEHFELESGSFDDVSMAHFIVYPDERLCEAEDVDWRFNGEYGTFDSFAVTPQTEGRYQIDVELWVGNICQSGSFVLTVGDGLPDDAQLLTSQVTDIVYLHDEEGYTLGDAFLHGYNMVNGEDIRWHLERVDENGSNPVEIWMEPDGVYCLLRYGGICETGTVTYRLSVETDGGLTGEHEYTLSVQELPENLPTELQVNLPGHYEIGETLEFIFFDSVTFANGQTPEDASLRALALDIENLPIWQENDASWTEGGFRITFRRNGRYRFDAALMIGNYSLVCPVNITVGSGVSDDAHMSINLLSNHLYMNHGGSWLGTAYLENYTLLEGEEVEWKLEFIDGSDSAHLALRDPWDGGAGINIFSDGTDDGESEGLYRVTAVTSDGFAWSLDFVVHVIHKADEMPSELTGPQLIVVNPGEAFVFEAEHFAIPNCGVADGNNQRYTLDVDARLQETEGFEWMNESTFFLQTDRDGRYTVRVFLQIGNYTLEREIILRVGSGLAEDVELAYDQAINTVYIGGSEYAFMGWAELLNAPVAAHEQLDWQLECLDEAPVADVYVEQDGSFCMVFYGQIRETGTTTWRLTVQTPDGFIDSCDFVLHVEEKPDNLPAALNVQTEYHLEAGERLSIDLNAVDFADGQVPEGADVRTAVPNLMDNRMWTDNESYWTDNGFEVVFHHNGRYEFSVTRQVGNHHVEALVRVYVGTGMADSVHGELFQPIHQAYIGVEQERYIANARLVDYIAFAGEEIWSLERLDEECTSDAEMYMSFDGSVCGLYVADTSGVSQGSIAYILRAHGETGLIWEERIALELMDMPENLPTALQLEPDTYEFTVGDYWSFPYQDVAFADGEVPEGAFVRTWLTDLEGSAFANEQAVFYNVQEMNVDFHTPGEYTLTLTRCINNYPVSGTITVIVREPQTHISAWMPFTQVYVGLSENEDPFLANVHLENIDLAEGESVQWSWEPVNLAEGEEPLLVMYGDVDNTWDDSRAMSLFYEELRGTGESTWRVTATVGEQSWSTDLTYILVDAPENLPASLDVPMEIFLGRNELFRFGYGDIIPGGELPEHADVNPEIWGLEESIDSQLTYQWIDEGFEVSFAEDGRYGFTAALRISNYQLSSRIWLTVGSGVNDKVYLSGLEGSSVMYSDGGDMWLADVYINGFAPVTEDEIRWSLHHVSGEDPVPVELYMGNTWGTGTGVNVFVRQIGYDMLSTDWELRAVIRDEVELVWPLTVHLQEQPVDLPTALDLGDTPLDVTLQPGDSFSFDSKTVNFADGSIPEDAVIRDEIWALEEGIDQQPDFHRFDVDNGMQGAGFSVTFADAGRYRFLMVRRINNYCVMEEVCITVGEIDKESITLVSGQHTDTLYTQGDYIWLGWWRLEGFRLLDRDEVDWVLERVTDENSPEIPLAEVYLADWWEGRGGLNLHVEATGDQLGTETYRLTCVVNSEELASTEFSVHVVEKPEGLPERIGGFAVDVQLDVGETYTLRYDQLQILDGTIPEGVEPMWEFWEVENLPNMVWLDNEEGFSCTFPYDGDAVFYVVMKLNNHMVQQEVRLTAGNGPAT